MWQLILLLLGILVGTYPTGGWLRLQGRNLASVYGCLSRSVWFGCLDILDDVDLILILTMSRPCSCRSMLY